MGKARGRPGRPLDLLARARKLRLPYLSCAGVFFQVEAKDAALLAAGLIAAIIGALGLAGLTSSACARAWICMQAAPACGTSGVPCFLQLHLPARLI